MEDIESPRSLSLTFLELRYWFQLVSFKYLVLTTIGIISYVVLSFANIVSQNILNSFIFIIISGSISFVVYYLLGSGFSHKLYYKENINTLNNYKLIEYSISAPILILSYTSLIPVNNWMLELIIYFLLILNVLVGGVVEYASFNKKTGLNIISSLVGLVLTISTFGTILYQLFQTDVNENYLVYIFIILFTLARFRFYYLLWKRRTNGQKRYLWISREFISLDIEDRIALVAFLYILILFM